MKFNLFFPALCSLLILFSCTNVGTDDKGGKKFAPKEKESTMTDAERQSAIAQMRNGLNQELDTALILGSGIKLSIMTPLPDAQEHVTESMSKDLAMKMLAIASQNGISGIGGDPTFVFLAGITGSDLKLTGTAPQKTMITYNLTFYVADVINGTVFGSATTSITGVGNNEQQAATNAAKELKNSRELQQMLKTSCEKIISYFNNNSSKIKAEIQALINANRYEEAYVQLRSIPSEATALYPWVAEQLPIVCQKIMLAQSAQSFAGLKAAIAAGNGEFNPEAGAYLAMIPTNAPEYAEAQKLYNDYTTRLRQQADDKTAWDRKQAERQMEIAHAENMLKIEMDARVAEAEAKSMSSMEMRKKIALEDAAGSPFKLLWKKAGYALNNLFGGME